MDLFNTLEEFDVPYRDVATIGADDDVLSIAAEVNNFNLGAQLLLFKRVKVDAPNMIVDSCCVFGLRHVDS